MLDQGLTPEQRVELERKGPERVTSILANWAGGLTGPESMIGGLDCGDIRRAAIDSWLTEKQAQKSAQERVDRLWVRVAAWAAIAGVVIQILIGR